MPALTIARFFSHPYNFNSRNGPTLLSFQQQSSSIGGPIGANRRENSFLKMQDDIPVNGSYTTAGSANNLKDEEDKAVSSKVDVDDVDEPGSVPPSPELLARHPSSSNSNSYQEDWEMFPPLDKVSVFDLLDDFDLTQRLEKWHKAISAQKEKVKKQRERLKTSSSNAKDRVVEEWKRRAPTAEERLDKYRRRMNVGVERLGKQITVTAREKVSFIAGVLNVFISGYLIGAFPEKFYIWFSVQLLYFMPIRYYRYHKIGYHFFLFDLCYFVDLLTVLSIWVFPNSKRLFISTFCLAFGNNAIAIAMWRNSLVFHSMDKVVRYVFSQLLNWLAFSILGPNPIVLHSVFVHIMPPAALHCLTHLTAPEILRTRFPAIYDVKFSDPNSPEHYGLWSMIVWATVPYTVWQLAYHYFITMRRHAEIAAGYPTSFTWLRKSYKNNFLGKLVLSLPDSLQEPAFMLIQYLYALVTMIPCPIWFWSKIGSTLFLSVILTWSVYNGSTFYIDVFGKRFQKELEKLKQDIAREQAASELGTSPAQSPETRPIHSVDSKTSLNHIPPLESSSSTTTDTTNNSTVRERK